MFTIRFEMRAPSSGAPAPDLYAAAIDMSAWAEDRGCVAAVLCEHHGAEDGYLPSPLMLASAIAARTERLILSLVVILPFYDPVRLAEDMAVLDLISHGRASYMLGIGYRAEEFDHFGLARADRGRLADEKLDVLRRLLAGEVVTRNGKRSEVRPRPQTPGGPTLMWGGASLAAARRAGRYGLGMLANGTVPGMKEAYEAACREHGHELGFTLFPSPDSATVCFVADDVDEAWDEIGTYLLHDAMSYSEWNPDNVASANISDAKTVDDLRRTSPSHVILPPEEAQARVARGEILNFSPLCGGLPPEVAWRYLRRAVDVAGDPK